MKRDESAFFIDIHAHDVIKYRRMNLRAFCPFKTGSGLQMFELNIQKNWIDALYARSSVRQYTSAPDKAQLDKLARPAASSAGRA